MDYFLFRDSVVETLAEIHAKVLEECKQISWSTQGFEDNKKVDFPSTYAILMHQILHETDTSSKAMETHGMMLLILLWEIFCTVVGFYYLICN